MQANTVILEEQGLRDGLQTLPQTLPVAFKVELATALAAAGLRRIQVASFVHPKLVPQMADAEALLQSLPRPKGVVYSALVLNVKGLERAIAAGVQHLAISLSASDTHSQKNTNMSLPEAKTAFREMVALARQHGITVRGGIQCAFGCRYEGVIKSSTVYDLVQHHLDAGVQEIALADSTGMGNPVQITAMMQKVMELCGSVPVSLHLHNTENKGYANVVAALQVGVRQFDTAFGGLGGCPFIKGATGNIATEDTAHLLHQMGYTTNIDIAQVARVSNRLAEFLGMPLPGLVYPLVGRTDIKMTEQQWQD